MCDASVINRRDESGDVTDDPAAKTNNKRLPIQTRRDHSVTNSADLLKGLRLLTCRNRDPQWAEIQRMLGFF